MQRRKRHRQSEWNGKHLETPESLAWEPRSLSTRVSSVSWQGSSPGRVFVSRSVLSRHKPLKWYSRMAIVWRKTRWWGCSLNSALFALVYRVSMGLPNHKRGESGHSTDLENQPRHVFAYESVTDYKQCNIWTRGTKRSVVCRQKQAQISELLNFAHFKNLFIINYGHCYWDTR